MKNLIKILFLLLTFSCTLEPKYVKPTPDVPLFDAGKEKNITQAPWQEFFQSPALQQVVQLALDHNRDLKIAALNVESVRALYDISKADLLPSISVTAYETKQGVPSAFARFLPRKQFRLSVAAAAYELDFFGKLRSLKKSALQKYLATEEAKNIIKNALITETVNAYTQLLLDEENLQISEENLAVETARYEFVEERQTYGIASQDDLLNVAAIVEEAKATCATYKKLIAQDKNALMILIGKFDEKLLPKNTILADIRINEDLLNLVPSTTLLARPDIKQAEYLLKSANADIGAARAAFFPSITLSGNYGYGSVSLDSLFQSQFWSFTPQVNIPIFNGGRNIANLKNANIKKQIEIVQYEKAIQTAFRETLDQFAERQAAVERLKSFDKISAAKKQSYKNAKDKYRQGINSALDLLTAKNIFLLTKQNQAIARKEYIANLSSLYKVLGGGSAIIDKNHDKKEVVLR